MVAIPKTKHGGHIGGIASLEFSSDGNRLLAVHGNEPFLVDVERNVVRTGPPMDGGIVDAVAFGSSRERETILALADRRVVAFDSRLLRISTEATPVIEEVKQLLDLLDPTLQVVLLTARPHRVHQLTEAWLRHYGIRWDLLVMRSWGDYDWARDFKQYAIYELRRYGFDLKLAFEDDRRNVEMFRAERIPCLYVHSGYYD